MKKMKVGELRTELKQFDQNELIELIVGLYKQHADVKVTLNRYFMEGFEDKEVDRLIGELMKLQNPKVQDMFRFTRLRDGAAIVKEANTFANPFSRNYVRVFYLRCFVEYVERQVDVIHSVSPGELTAYFTEFERMIKSLRTEPELFLDLTKEVDYLIAHVPAEDPEGLKEFWEKKKRLIHQLK